uniref:Uncharacterized protein n=1 Tax=Arundo donax TaxID=35708 RepID=A0A0A9AZC5_ARUDO
MLDENFVLQLSAFFAVIISLVCTFWLLLIITCDYIV